MDCLDKYQGTYAEKVQPYMYDARNRIYNGKSSRQEYRNHDYTAYCLKKRVKGTVYGIDEIKRLLAGTCSDSRIESVFAYVNGATANGGYNGYVDALNNIALGAAVWILDELLISGKTEEAFHHLEAGYYEWDTDMVLCPVFHPVHDSNVIRSLVYIIRHRNGDDGIKNTRYGSLVYEDSGSSRKKNLNAYRYAFDSIMALIDPERIKQATEKYEKKIWEFYEVAMKIQIAVLERADVLRGRFDSLAEEYEKLLFSKPVINTVLRVPVLPDAGREANSEKIERLGMRIDGIEKELGILERINPYQLIAPNEREKTVKQIGSIISDELAGKLVQFNVDDPFESAFALMYLLDSDSIIPWLYFGSLGTAYSIIDQLPFSSEFADRKPLIRLSQFDSALYAHRYSGQRYAVCNDGGYQAVEREYAKNLSQLLFSNTMSLVPRVVPDQINPDGYLESLGNLTGREKEICELFSYVLCACQVQEQSLDEFHAWAEVDSLEEEYYGTDSDDYMTGSDDYGADSDNYEEENKKLRDKNRELIGRIRELSVYHKEEKTRALRLQKDLELSEKELADLRELVFNLENRDESDADDTDEIQYPYMTEGTVLSYGGHETWLKEMRKKLPGVMFFDPDTIPNISLLRNADEVWLQTDCLSHSDFYRIINVVKNCGVELHYYMFSGSGKCAAQLVRTLKKKREGTDKSR